jgi:8-amino-3,8-dideoxy-alpha-D-manno-octulosonate transaminase
LLHTEKSLRAAQALAVNGGPPTRTAPLPLEFSGAYFYGAEELHLVSSIVKARSPFRYYGLDLQRTTERFEKEFAAFVGMPYALGVSSGTAALTVAMMALGVGPGCEVIVPGYLWVSTVGAVVRLGGIPVLADIDATFGLAPADVEKKITSRTKAVVAVHMSGASGNVKELARLCRKSGVFLLEDVAQAAGASVKSKRLGSFGDISIFSFQLNKTMTTGEGGAVCTRTRQLYDRVFAAHDLGYARNAAGRLKLDDLDTATWGCGARMNELTGALALVQLRKLPKICAAMRTRKHELEALLSDIEGLAFRRVDDSSGEVGNFLLTTFPTPGDAAFFVRALRAEGIVTDNRGLTNLRMTDWGLHIYYNIPALVNKLSVSHGNNPWTDLRNAALTPVSYDQGTLPVCDDLISRTLLLCIPPTLTRGDLCDISSAFHKVAAARPLATARPQGPASPSGEGQRFTAKTSMSKKPTGKKSQQPQPTKPRTVPGPSSDGAER